MTVDVLVPVLGRPERVTPLVESIRATGPAVRELFLASPLDEAELAALDEAGARYIVMPEPRQPGDYARKINAGAATSDADWWFLGADDLRFHRGWLERCLAAHAASGAFVIGTNDLGNRMVMLGRHATHSLVHRSYLEQGTIDEPGKLLHEGYDHNSVDVEFTETAIIRRTWAFAREAYVEHLHYLWRKGVPDATYALGQRNYGADRELLRERGHLWHHRDVMAMMRNPRRRVASAGRREIRLR